MSDCPYCHRHLLTQASPCCNWCGREIPDASYQQQAEVKREAFFLEQAMHDAASLAQIEAMNVNPLTTHLDPLLGLPLGAVFPMRPRPIVAPRVIQAKTPPTETPPEETPGGRFQHLEL